MLDASTAWTSIRICWCCLVLLHVGCESLKDLKVSVPSAVRKGETAVFMCDFNLEDDQLYTVKWYKGRKEFYRYTPKDEYPIKTFHIDHVYVDRIKSNMTQLTLLRVSPPLSGIYNCEVSAESPSFHTVLASGEMTVVEPPTRDPVIHGLKQSYRAAEKLEATCVADASKPGANITWFINGEKAPRDSVHYLPPLSDKNDLNLLRTRSQLSFIVKTHSFRNGRIFLRCTASILNLYQPSVERRVEEASMINPEVVVLVGNLDGDQDRERGLNSAGSPNTANLIGIGVLLQIHLMVLVYS